jgi:multiple sugar transport system substrate-binding protein
MSGTMTAGPTLAGGQDLGRRGTGRGLTRATLLTRVAWTASLSAAGTLAAACGAAAQPKASGAAPAATVAQGSTIQWMTWASGINADIYKQEGALFEQMHADQKLKVDQQHLGITSAEFLDKLTAVIAAGTPPAVTNLLATDVAVVQGRKALRSLSPFMKRDKYDLSDFYPAGFDQYRYGSDGKPMGSAGASGGGDIFGGPRDFPTRAIAYNVDAFNQNGVKLPATSPTDPSWTFQAFLDAAQKLLKKDPSALSGVARWGWQGHDNTFQQWLPWVFSNGGELVSPDGKESRMDNPRTVEAIQFLADLQQKQHVAPTPDEQKNEGALNTAFFSGRIAMQHFGPASVGAYQKGINSFAWDVCPFPRGAGSSAPPFSGSAWVMPSGWKDMEGAWLFMQFMLGPEVGKMNAETGTGVPNRQSVMQQVFIKQPAPPKNLAVFAEDAKVARILPQIPRWNDMTAAIEKQLAGVWAGQQTAKDACAQIKALVDPMLKS